jgi:hypothetical protein
MMSHLLSGNSGDHCHFASPKVTRQYLRNSGLF